MKRSPTFSQFSDKAVGRRKGQGEHQEPRCGSRHKEAADGEVVFEDQPIPLRVALEVVESVERSVEECNETKCSPETAERIQPRDAPKRGKRERYQKKSQRPASRETGDILNIIDAESVVMPAPG